VVGVPLAVDVGDAHRTDRAVERDARHHDAADAPLIDAMSCGFSRSAPRIVAMTWTSLREPSGTTDAADGR
jgi:hypothetical protein